MSNPVAQPQALRLDEDLFALSGPQRIAGVNIGTRMTLVRLPGERLLLHSPIPRTAEVAEAVEALGTPAFLVAPNKVHHLFLSDWADAYPDATLYGAPGLRDKRRDLVFHRELGDAPPPDWCDALDQVLVAGIPHVNEVVFFHRASRTLLLTDLAMNFPELPDGFLSRLFVRAMALQGGVRTSRLMQSLVRERAATRASLERILDFDFDRVVLTHGEICESGGAEALRSAWSRLLAAS